MNEKRKLEVGDFVMVSKDQSSRFIYHIAAIDGDAALLRHGETMIRSAWLSQLELIERKKS